MAVISKKDKLVEEAQKFVLRGQLDKAIKSYEQVLALDPSAISHRQKFADLLVKAGRFDEARTHLETIGKHFSSNGFYLKAIAVFKQIQKSFPADINVTLTLADLNQKHGLIANALSEYKQVFDFYEKAGNIAEALKILDIMQTVDPQNVNIKIKLAEAYYQHGKQDEAYAVFAKTASLLQERNDNATLVKLTARIQQLFPSKSEFMLEVLSDQIANGNAANAVNGLQAMLRSNPKDKRVWQLTIQAYEQLKESQRLKAAYTHFLKFFPDEPAAMAGVIAHSLTDGDVKGTLQLVERYEQELLEAGQGAVLEKTYQALDEIDPINARLLEGWLRVCRATGNAREAASVESKLNSLRSVSSGSGAGLTETYVEGPLSGAAQDIFEAAYEDTAVEALGSTGADDAHKGGFSTESSQIEQDEVPLESLDEEIEIEVDIDIDLDLDADTSLIHEQTDNWLDSVGELFNAIETAPRGVKFGNEMDSSDAQSHYDLGLAFKEMGLFDEAINEFRTAAKDPERRVDCMILQGVCLRERGELATADNVFRSLMKPGLELEDLCAVKYELALTSAALGNNEEAAALFAEIDSINPGFRDVSSRLDSASIEDSLDFSDDELQGFDLK